MEEFSISPDKPSFNEGDPSKRVCDQCRLRKTRCDKGWPCSTCRTANRQCTSTGAGQRPKEHRQRILISSRYERKIDEIISRLGSLEILLNGRDQSSSDGGGSSNSSSNTTTTANINLINNNNNNIDGHSIAIATGSSASDYDSANDNSPFGPDSGLAKQTDFAREFLEKAAQRSTMPAAANPEMTAALNNLGQLVDLQKRPFAGFGLRVHFPLKQRLPPAGLAHLPLPPYSAVSALLDNIKNSPPTLFSITCTIVGINDFDAICRAAYYPSSAPDDSTDARFIIVNAMLYNLFTEQFSVSTDPVVQGEYGSYIQQCSVNIETGLASMSIVLSATVENVQALLLGALYAIDISRAFVAWHLVSTAARLCQAGRFHHADALRNNSPQLSRQKRIIFWHVYSLERGVCLGLGRSSVILECDIDITREPDLEGFGNPEISGLFGLWIRIGGLQGRIYESLRAASALPHKDLVRNAERLAIECRELEIQSSVYRKQLYGCHANLHSSDVVHLFLRGEETQFLATVTLVYRLIPASESSISRFSNECLEAVRRAIHVHQDCIRFIDSSNCVKSIYVHWYLTITPFTPFFVLSCYVIETLSMHDLQILRDFVMSFSSCRGDSETIDKLYKLCHVMYDAVRIYVESRLQVQPDQPTGPIGHEFGMYLSQLGLLPVEDRAEAGGQYAPQGQKSGQTTQMAEFLLGNRNIMGLLEEDMSQIDFSQWM
ncbi:hypothetical protein L249_3155 [Ophiocordyceps polyrhachis-furcata BCC 54312]|uniref:Zn(2)-C6 fungal-type domain-containing protein n=1 Tax=Ophiocordyceps polyrhachis-furcata BCC 54312 TaxID=1330021 RepID=A0A367LS47_9HYPO|nr:hypothetical protein L249_3155 [Ophiocordyceps polyrhachis-furcata BCC 54312]